MNRPKPADRRRWGLQVVAGTALRSSKDWSTQIGVALIILGVMALVSLGVAKAASPMLAGWITVLAGLAEALHAFRVRRTDNFFLHLVPGIAGVPIGLLIATHPSAGELTWMLLFAAVFTVIGLFRAISAARLRFPSWPWAVFDGTIALLLGTVLWAAWTWLGTWFFAFAAGISLIVRGWSWIMFGRAVHRPALSERSELQSTNEQSGIPATEIQTDSSLTCRTES